METTCLCFVEALQSALLTSTAVAIVRLEKTRVKEAAIAVSCDLELGGDWVEGVQEDDCEEREQHKQNGKNDLVVLETAERPQK